MSEVLCAVEDGVATLTLNNPPLNLVTLALTRRLHELLGELAADEAVRALVLTGSGEKAFCAGSDVREFPALMAAGTVVPRKLALENETWSRLAAFPKPTVAALNGIAYGGGLELAVCCDLLVAEEGSSVALPELRLGVFPGGGGTVRVTRRIGEGRAKEMMFLGDPLPVETALAWGLVNAVVPKGRALAAAQETARRLAGQPALALLVCKEAVALAFDRPEAEAIAATLPMSEAVFASPDCAEGVRAFFAKEKPRFG
ncbi:MAG TPA: enoyl-CoA hydratase-related protein [Beijerinckiaceae bacterium]|nr:enoyl-CoA hydratase-related protein [Beijerinckiaceae bacterium]